MNDLPLEMVFTILHYMPYSEKFRLRSVCSLWRDFFDEQIPELTWEDIDLNLEIREMEVPLIANQIAELYRWYLVPANEDLPSLCRFYATETIRISNEAENGDDTTTLLADTEEMKLALQSVHDCLGEKRYRLVRDLTHTFMEETFKIYNEHYKTVQISMPQDLLAIILAKRTSASFHVEFTPRSYLRYANGVKSAQDFKMFRHFEDGEWKWEGLGDNWENMTARQILEQFSPTRVEGGQVTFKLLCLNRESNTISHLFEAIVYLSEQIRAGSPIVWQ